MAELSVLVVDEEGFEGSLRRCSPGTRIDVMKFVSYLENFRPRRTMLWIKWIILDRSHETNDGTDPRQPYVTWLRARGIRVEAVKPKPINRFPNRKEPNACDFAVIEAIRLGAKKASTVIVAGNDGHFAPAIDQAHHEFGCRTEVVCDHQGLSSEIAADYFHFLEDILAARDIAYRGNHSNGERAQPCGPARSTRGNGIYV